MARDVKLIGRKRRALSIDRGVPPRSRGADGEGEQPPPREGVMAKGKGGRPSKFDPRMIEGARKIAAFGATHEEMADERPAAHLRNGG